MELKNSMFYNVCLIMRSKNSVFYSAFLIVTSKHMVFYNLFLKVGVTFFCKLQYKMLASSMMALPSQPGALMTPA